MRLSAYVTLMVRFFFSFLLSIGIGVIFLTSVAPAHAQTLQPSTTPANIQTATSENNSSTYEKFRTPDTNPDVPQNSHTYTQAVMIDLLSALTCQLTGIDPVNPKQSCLTVDPVTKKIGLIPTQNQFGQAQGNTPQVGGALGAVTNMVSVLYTPTVSSSQYTQYLSENFGIVKPALAQTTGTTCSTDPFGYGFCGLKPIFKLWVAMRDISYAFLIICFVFLAIGVMLRFKIDPRTVMTLQNQIPRVIIAIVLITFSYAIAGGLIDVMWTATYVGINLIASSSPDTMVANQCQIGGAPKPIADVIQTQLLDNPMSFANTLFNADCNGNLLHSGIMSLSEKVSQSLGGLIQNVVANILGLAGGDCGLTNLGACVAGFFLWITEQIVKIIIIVALLISLFRLWFELIKTYLTLLIFIIVGPIYIVMGLIPGRPLGVEKWIRIIFANLAAFPAVAFLLVFGDVMVNAIPAGSSPQNIFIPPLIGNPNIAVFSNLLAFGAVMLAPTIPGMIKKNMKAEGQGKYGATIAAGVGVAAGAAMAPGKKAWGGLTRKDQHGHAVGAVAVGAQELKQKFAHGVSNRIGGPFKNFGRKSDAIAHGGGTGLYNVRQEIKDEKKFAKFNKQGIQKQQENFGNLSAKNQSTVKETAHGEAISEHVNRGYSTQANPAPSTTNQGGQTPPPLSKEENQKQDFDQLNKMSPEKRERFMKMKHQEAIQENVRRDAQAAAKNRQPARRQAYTAPDGSTQYDAPPRPRRGIYYDAEALGRTESGKSDGEKADKPKDTDEQT